MTDRFVTVATFPDPSLAYLARGHLEAAGIQSFISNENIDPIFGNTGGWVKLEVAEGESLRALAVLESRMPEEDEPPSDAIMSPEDTVAVRDRFAAPPEEDEPEEDVRRLEARQEEIETPDNERSRLAARALVAAVAGIIIWPIQVYVTILLVQIWWQDEPLTPAARPRLWIAVLLNALFMLPVTLFVLALVRHLLLEAMMPGQL